MAILHRVAGTGPTAAAADVVFVHGLDGHWRETWSNGKESGFWPEWLAENYPEVTVWSLEYDASSSGWRGVAMPIVDRATNVLDAILNEGLGKKPICFVTHSMGGLVIKQMLHYCDESSDDYNHYKQVLSATRGVVFLSTPHTGSDIARLSRYASIAIRRTAAAKDMESHAQLLIGLNRWYRNNSLGLGITNKVYYETRKTVYFLLRVVVVDASSAERAVSGVEVIPVDADHISISKPDGRDDQVFRGTRRFIADLLRQDSQTCESRVNGDLSIATEFLKPVYKRSSGGELILIGYVFEEDA